VFVIDADAGTVVSTLTLGGPGRPSAPEGIAVTPDGRRLYVANNGPRDVPGSTVTVRETAGNTIVGLLRVDARPWDVAVSPNGRQVYVVSQGGALTIFAIGG
jgi:DNA-binding beta-propeller fold protein YncE